MALGARPHPRPCGDPHYARHCPSAHSRRAVAVIRSAFGWICGKPPASGGSGLRLGSFEPSRYRTRANEHRLADAYLRLAYRDLAGVAALLLLERASLGAVGLAVDLSLPFMSTS